MVSMLSQLIYILGFPPALRAGPTRLFEPVDLRTEFRQRPVQIERIDKEDVAGVVDEGGDGGSALSFQGDGGEARRARLKCHKNGL